MAQSGVFYLCVNLRNLREIICGKSLTKIQNNRIFAENYSAMATKLLPYGVSDFTDLIKSNLYYVDKTQYIELIEKSPRYLFLIRPRRFGKSLFLNMLSAYYDVNRKEQFEQIFGNLYIGKHPTEDRNKYLILSFNFSNVNTSVEKLERSFEQNCYESFVNFSRAYKKYFDEDFGTELEKREDSTSKLAYLSNRASEKDLPVYLFIDEYDKFANTILASPMDGHERYKALTHGGGFYKNFFTYVKTATTANDAAIKKMFITGVSPVTMDDVTSGFNIGTNITINREFNSVLGFSRDEVIEMMNYYKSEGMINDDIDKPLSIMEEWYDNYCFAKACIGEKVFNSDMVLYFIESYIRNKEYPDILIDSNVRTDYGKLRHFIILGFFQNRILCDDNRLNIMTGGNLVHDMQHDLLNNCAQSSRTGFTGDGEPCNFLNRVVLKG